MTRKIQVSIAALVVVYLLGVIFFYRRWTKAAKDAGVSTSLSIQASTQRQALMWPYHILKGGF